MGVLTLAYTVSFIDRQVLNLMVEPIRSDLGLSDTRISLLQGIAFAIFYSFFGVPIGRLADSTNRRNIIAAGIALWSLMTAACGLARSFLHLFLARIGVGIGEAALSPPALSIIADYFPPTQLARATGTYTMGIYAGAGLAMLVGGGVIDLISSANATFHLPVLGAMRAWQLTFIVVGLPGLAVALLMFTIKEPTRRGVAAEKQSAGVPFREIRRFLVAEKRLLVSIFTGFSFLGIVMIGILSWVPTYFIRIHGWTASEIGYAYGLILLVGGTSGAFAGGWLADWLHARGHPQAPIRVAIVLASMLLPFAVGMALAPNPELAIVLLVPTTFLLGAPSGLSITALQIITPNRMRAQITAIFFLTAAITGSGFGPMAVALCTDFVFQSDQAVGYSLALVSGCLIPLSVLCLWFARR